MVDARKAPLNRAGHLPCVAPPALNANHAAVDFPPPHLVKEVLRGYAALTNNDFVELEGGYAFFGAGSVLPWSDDLSLPKNS